MTGPVPYGEGFIIIRPDFGNFDDELRRGVNRVLDQLGDDFSMFERFVNDIFEEIADDMVFHMRYADRVISRIFAELARDARMCGLAIAEAFAFGSRIAREELDDLEDRAQRAFRNIRQASRRSAGGIGGIFGSLGARLTSLFSGLFNFGGSAGGAGAGAGAKVGGSLMSSLSGIGGSIGGIIQIAAMAALIPLALELVGVIINLAGALFALPAAIGVAAAAFIPLKIAFNGVGEALSAIWSQDPEKIAEAFKNLAPHAKAVLREFIGFVDPLKKIGKDIQQGFFVPLEGAITKLGNTVLPVLQKNIAGIGWVWGKTISQMIDAISTPVFANALQDIIRSAMNIIAYFGPVISKFITAVIGLISKGLPYVERFAYWIGSLVSAFADWISKSTQSGKVTGWLDQAWQAGKKLYEIIKQISIFAGLMFGSFGDEGQDTLGGMAEQIAKINEYLRSAEGQESLHNLGVIIHWVGNAIVWLMGTVVGVYNGLNTLFDLTRSGSALVQRLVSQWVNGWKNVWATTKSTWSSITNAVNTAWNSTVSFLKNGWNSVKTFFVDGWHSLTSTVTGWYTSTKNAIVGFPAALKTYLVDSIHNAAYNFGYAVGTVIRIILDLPIRVMEALHSLWNGIVTVITAIGNFFTQTIPTFANNVAKWFTDMWHTAWEATTNFVSNTAQTVSELPGKVGNYVTQTRDRVVDKFNELRNTAIDRVRGLVSGAREEAAKLPGQIGNAIQSVVSTTYNIGRDMIYGMINGIRSAAGALWNAARGVVMDAWQGAKDALKSKSPSKKWAELGEDSAAGYQVGFDGYNLTDSIASAVKMPLDAFARSNARAPQAPPNVSVGGASLVAYLQIGDDQLRPVIVTTLKEHPQEVSLAAQQGDTQLARRR
jgi:phage-related protein